jgi:16S rRNA (guanine1207-N2)-methyltransferase
LEHYFSAEPGVASQEREVRFTVFGEEYRCTTDAGVFGKSGLDEGSRLLIEHAAAWPAARVLDLGAGWGPVGVVVGHRHKAEVWAVESNARAAALCERNLERFGVEHHVVLGDGLSAIGDERFDLILLNPPIRAGKKVYYPWLGGSREHLLPGGSLWVVVRKDQGARSLRDELSRHFSRVDDVAMDKGYRLYRAS